MNPGGLSEPQLETLRDLRACWGTGRFVLIGAQALGCFLHLGWRETQDIDVTVMTSVSEYPAGLDALPGWSRDPAISHRWHSRSGVGVDVVPTGIDGHSTDALVWPGEDRTLSRVGLRLAHDHAVEVMMSADLAVMVASLPSLCVLKMIAYLDRPHERQRDLIDLAQVLRIYPQEVARRFEDERVFQHDLDYDQAGPFLLGWEIGALGLDAEEMRSVDEFLSRVDNDELVAGRMARELGLTVQRSAVRRLVAALRLGLRSFRDG
jgi:predicted nucleotidyltransferase